MVSKRVVPPAVLKPAKPSPGRNAYMKNGYLYSEPLKVLSRNPSLQDIFATMVPIDLDKCTFSQNLILEPDQPGYQLLQDFFESDISPNCLEIMQLLLDHGADPNKKTRYGDTALHTAAHFGNTNVIKLLLQHEADVTITNRDGKIPALEAKNPKMAQLLKPIKNTEHNSNQSNSNCAFFKSNSSKGTEPEEKFSLKSEVT